MNTRDDLRLNFNLTQEASRCAPPLVLKVAALMLIAWLVPAESRAAGSAATGSMSSARAMQTATVLNDGRVLVTGGNQGTGTAVSAISFYAYGTLKYGVNVGGGNITESLPDAERLRKGGTRLIESPLLLMDVGQVAEGDSEALAIPCLETAPPTCVEQGSRISCGAKDFAPAAGSETIEEPVRADRLLPGSGRNNDLPLQDSIFAHAGEKERLDLVSYRWTGDHGKEPPERFPRESLRLAEEILDKQGIRSGSPRGAASPSSSR